MKIKVVIPNAGMDRTTLDERETMLSAAVSSGTKVSVDCIPSGPESIESNTDEVMAGPLLLPMARQAEKDGFDAFVVYCFSDLAVPALRENVNIPVVGPGEVALAIADTISNGFLIVTTIEANVSRTSRRLMLNPVAQRKMRSIRALNIPVVDLREDPEVTCSYLVKVCEQSVQEDGIDTMILGCLGMACYGGYVERACGVRVIDPAFAALAWAEMTARLKMTPSRRAVAECGKG